MQLNGQFWLCVVIVCLICGFASCDIAIKKGYGGVAPFFLGLLFNILGVLYAVGLPETLEVKREHALEIEKAIKEWQEQKAREEKAAEEYVRKEAERYQARAARDVDNARSIPATGERHIKPGAIVMCRKCGGLMEIYDDNTCVICGSKLIPD